MQHTPAYTIEIPDTFTLDDGTTIEVMPDHDADCPLDWAGAQAYAYRSGYRTIFDRVSGWGDVFDEFMHRCDLNETKALRALRLWLKYCAKSDDTVSILHHKGYSSSDWADYLITTPASGYDVTPEFDQWCRGDVYLAKITAPNGDSEWIGSIYADDMTAAAKYVADNY